MQNHQTFSLFCERCETFSAAGRFNSALCDIAVSNLFVFRLLRKCGNSGDSVLDERHYLDFVMKLDEHSEIKTVYIVTDSEAGYRDMIAGMEDKDTYQLYRDYLDNFRINSVRR